MKNLTVALADYIKRRNKVVSYEPQPHKDEIILQKILSVLEKKYKEVL